MSIETLISRLDGVRETGHGKYVARCPAHNDRSPSLAIKECDDGRILLHDFAGCETEDILSALGLTFSDVMPERLGSDTPLERIRRPFDARQVLETLDHEALVVSVIAADVLKRREIDSETWDRLGVATHRIGTARDSCSPARASR